VTERELLENIRRSPEAQKLLSVLRFAEGTGGHKNPYAVTFGGGTLSDLSRHPDTVYKNRSAAAGAYQFLPGTWNTQAQRLGLPDFGPRSQDIAALALARNRLKPLGGLAVLQKEGLSPRVLNALAPEWASLPTLSGASFYGQPVKSRADLERVYAQTAATGLEAAPAPSAASTPAKLPRMSFPQIMGDVIKQFGSRVFGSLSEAPEDKTAEYLQAAALAEDPDLAAKYQQLAIQTAGQDTQGDLISSISALPVALLDAYGAVKDFNSRAQQLERSMNPDDVVSSNTPATGANFVARTGSTGVSTGPHLDIRYASGQPITPKELDEYLRIGGKRPSELPLTSPYGPRKVPTAGASSFHRGIDIGVPTGTEIIATGGASLRRSLGDTGAGGYTVEIDIPGRGVARLLHLTPGSSPLSKRS
jgi:muramidase (phage lysozyme)